MELHGMLGIEGDCGMQGLLSPSPRSEAVAHELEELSLQLTPNLPPLNERKNVLQLRLQQRRTREQLVDQGIMPPLKSPAAFHEQIRSLERARTENFLKHKIRSRPERSELVRMHILQETLAEPSLQATQMKLKRARLADDLNEKIAQRPGPLELVEKNILPVDSSLKGAIVDAPDGEVDYPKTRDVYLFDEDSSDALSPEQPASQESQSSAASPGEHKISEASSPLPNSTLQYCPQVSLPSDFLKPGSSAEHHTGRLATNSFQPTSTVAPSKPTPTLVKQSQPKTASERSRSKKGREAKPRVKKLKYHQYIPPDQKAEPSEAPMDSSYARLLQQQQLFLQLQILSQQQQQHYNYQAILPAPLNRPATDNLNTSLNNNIPASIVIALPTSGTLRQKSSLANRKPGPLPANLDDMKVAELKMELKLRGLPVSGTKTDLIERLKPHQENSTTISTRGTMTTTIFSGSAVEVLTSASLQTPFAKEHWQHSSQLDSMSSTPPVSPVPSELSSLNTEDSRSMDTFSEIMGVAPAHASGASPRKGNGEDSGMELESSIKDRKLHEKELQIEDLMKKLEQEQRLVEELKMQLEVEKLSQSQQTGIAAQQNHSGAAEIKDESRMSPNCSSFHPASRSPVVQQTPMLIKQEQEQPPQAALAQGSACLQQFFVSHQRVPQVIGQPQTLLTTQPGTRLLLPVSLSGTNTTIQLPTANVKPQQPQQVLQAAAPASAPGLIQASIPQIQPQKQEALSPQQLLNQNHHTSKAFPTCTTSSAGFQFQSHPVTVDPQRFLNSSAESRLATQGSPGHTLHNGPTHKPGSPSQPQPQSQLRPQFISVFGNPIHKNKDPPRYEEAVKQSRNMQAPPQPQVPTATSQQMDDLFDILIESGEISPFLREESPTKLMPVTASITTLPINTVLSRPPQRVQMAPSLTLDPVSSLSLASENQLEAFLDGAPHLGSSREHLSLIEDLQSQLLSQSGSLSQPHSPMDIHELPFSTDRGPSVGFDLHDPNLDNMEWLDLTVPGPSSSLAPLGMAPPGGVFSDFLDTHNLQLPWE
ncbi:myocardin-related transcription factor B-like isoform X2 [Acipenser ruthenus]|uniref:myocardin-related transcription factor B-like isoform X2 n=1 Tax=Acipenser ruthenus TaxID=7906 RepID=UPI00145B73DB|nr:myocardin-related transcription factor B-like isoform X2 [Acipenser ruthenus]XP_058851849.1 myocardin-related transcription factor B-like isoform X2 [Acipenser ruthenus]